MSSEMLICLVFGVALMLAEFVLPGFISLFLGMAGVLVAGMIGLGWISAWPSIAMAWVGVAIVLVLTLRSTLMRYFPGEKSKGSVDDDSLARGTLVEVVKDVTESNEDGQIMFRDAVWSARSASVAIPRGARARLLRRENLLWIVEPER